MPTVQAVFEREDGAWLFVVMDGKRRLHYEFGFPNDQAAKDAGERWLARYLQSTQDQPADESDAEG